MLLVTRKSVQPFHLRARISSVTVRFHEAGDAVQVPVIMAAPTPAISVITERCCPSRRCGVRPAATTSPAALTLRTSCGRYLVSPITYLYSVGS